MNLKKISVIGHFGFGQTLLNGQTVKTKIVTAQLEKSFGEQEVIKKDTRGGIKSLITLPFLLLSTLKASKNIAILPAQNGLRVIAPALVMLNGFFKRKLHYIVIGGWLAEYIEDKPFLAKQLKKFDGIYVETVTMKKALEDMGFNNALVMPNCKPLEILKPEKLIYSEAQPLKLCTFSRVMKEKGIDEAVCAVKSVNEKAGQVVYTLDIFGQVDENQTEWFETLKADFPEYVRYGGLVPFDKSVEVIKNYFALLFPTYYEGEGFAGTVIDAFAAGVPVVASDWKYNTEIVEAGVTGEIVPAKDAESLADLLLSLCEVPNEWNKLKENCIKQAVCYLPEKAISVLIEKTN